MLRRSRDPIEPVAPAPTKSAPSTRDQVDEETTSRQVDPSALDESTSRTSTASRGSPTEVAATPTVPVLDADPQQAITVEAKVHLAQSPSNPADTSGATSGEPTVVLSPDLLASMPASATMYADPVAAYAQYEATRADRAEAVADARADYHRALAEVERVAERYQEALRNNDPAAAMAAKADLMVVRANVDVMRHSLEVHEGELAEADQALGAFAAQYPAAVEQATGLTAEQRGLQAEHDDLQRDVAQLSAELGILNDPSYAQQLALQKSYWSTEQQVAEVVLEHAVLHVTATESAFNSSLIGAVTAAGTALANPLTYSGASLSAQDAATFAMLAADPTANPLQAYSFLASANILAEDHPAMVQLRLAHDQRADAIEARDAAIDRNVYAVTALANVDAATVMYAQEKQELQMQLQDTQFALQVFESDHPEFGDWSGDELGAARAALAAAERQQVALEEARIAHLERSLASLEAIAADLDPQNLAVASGGLTFVLAGLAATDELDRDIRLAGYEVDAAQADLDALLSPAEAAAEVSIGEEQGVVLTDSLDVTPVALDVAFGSGADDADPVPAQTQVTVSDAVLTESALAEPTMAVGSASFVGQTQPVVETALVAEPPDESASSIRGDDDVDLDAGRGSAEPAFGSRDPDFEF